MDVKYINPFLESVVSTLGQLGINDVTRGKIQAKEHMQVDMDITSVIGIVGEIRGNIAYSLSSDTAKKIVSTMMMGAPVETIDSMARSAISELSNMFTGTALLAFANTGLAMDITPPSLIFGEDIYFIISSVSTVSVEMETPLGKLEINIGLEV